MAFSSPGAGNPEFGSDTGVSSDAQTQTGPDLEEINTEALGFHSFAGESKVRLLPTAWPLDALPPPTASLLSVASTRGLLAAAGPDSVIIASTESVRLAFTAESTSASDIKPFTPQLVLPIGTRVSQVVFSADENYLAISAEVGGGLAVYDVQAIMQGSTQSAFELSTNGASLRALTPNPTAERAELFAVVTVNGQLMIANMKTRQLLNGPNGQVMMEGVSCVSWSPRGKQLVAGLGNGAGFQMTPEGQSKAEIPKPLTVEGDQHVSSTSWLENNVFLMAHTPSLADPNMPLPTQYTLVTRQPPASYMYQKLPEVCSPFGINRSPSFQFMQRLRDFPPNIQDIIAVASTSSEDVGLFTRSKAPLVSDVAPEKITNFFTTTSMANDSRRAQIPMTEDMTSNTSAIGMAIDLSSKTQVPRPLPGEEMDESPTPLPALMILNHEGVLMAWWVVYADSIRQGTAYPGLVALAGSQQPQTQVQTQVTQPMGINPPSQSAYGQSAFGTTSTLAAFGGTPVPVTPAFGATNTPASSAGTFGTAPALGSQQSPWGGTGTSSQLGAAPAFGRPAFGTSTPLGTSTQGAAFGASGGLGNRPSPWGSTTAATPAAPSSVFGQPGGLGMRTGSAFGSTPTSSVFGARSSNATSGLGAGGGFASFANAPGFAATSAAQGSGQSVFGQPNPAASFGSATQSSGESVLGKVTPAASFTSAMDVGSSFGGTPRKAEVSTGLFGSGSGFVLTSSWKNEDAEKKEHKSPADTTSFFGGDFGKILGDAVDDTSALQTQEADMLSEHSDSNDLLNSPEFMAPSETTTLVDTPAPSKLFSAPPTTGGLFGTRAQSETTPAAVQNSTSALPLSGKPSTPITATRHKSPEIKSEPVETPFGVSRSLPQPPIPPDTISKASYTPGDSSASSTAASKSSNEDVPLPPDFSSVKSKAKLADKLFTDAPIPPDFLPSKSKLKGSSIIAEQQPAPAEEDEERGLNSEDSGVDVAQELSPTSDLEQSPKVTPESSFVSQDKSPLGGLFTRVERPQAQGSKSLFGEVGLPIFYPPSKLQESPRSPSPTRPSVPGHLRPDTSRSVSAPGVPARGGINRKVTLGRPLPSQPPLKTRAAIEKPRNSSRERLAVHRLRQEVEEDSNLSDREDERVREELATEVHPTLTLDPFLAHQDYVGNIVKPGIPGQIEKVYRDINSMIDTLGLNARSLQAFTKGHSELNKDGGRTREDLEAATDWILIEIADLSAVENSLQSDLEQGRLTDIEHKLASLHALRKDLAKLRTKDADVKRAVDLRSDPAHVEALRSAPLSAQQTSLRNDLRRDFTTFQKSLADAEEGISMLRAKLASVDSAKGGGKVPTVEAVERTILKMTGMVERKSGDIDLLEMRMRKLGLVGLGGGGSAAGSREASPFVTPPTSVRRGGGRASGLGESINVGARFYTPKSAFGASGVEGALGRTAGTPGKLAYVTEEEARRYAVKMGRRRKVFGALKTVLGEGEIRLRKLDVWEGYGKGEGD